MLNIERSTKGKLTAMKHWTIFPLLCVSITITGCGSGEPTATNYEQAQASRGSVEFDEDAAKEDAVADLSGQTFQDVGDTSRCTDDCSGHDAGWQWAQDNDITDSYDCSGSGSFLDGCEAYAEELENRVEEARDNAE
jgi:hypothetical protein